MYRVEYCDDPNNPILIKGEEEYGSDFEIEYEKNMDILDNFEALTMMYKIIELCKNELYLALDDENTLWPEINKVWLNYLNSIYSCKEFISNYEPSLMDVHDKYYKKDGWYRFICDYRNKVVHSSEIIRERTLEKKEILVEYDGVHETKRKVRSLKKTIENMDALKNKLLKDLDTKVYKKTSRGIEKEYLIAKKIIDKVNGELENMKEEITLEAFGEEMNSALEWFIDKIPVIDGEYKYAFIVDYDKYEKNNNEGVLEPNFTMEQFVYSVFYNIGTDSLVAQKIVKILENHNYNEFFD